MEESAKPNMWANNASYYTSDSTLAILLTLNKTALHRALPVDDLELARAHLMWLPPWSGPDMQLDQPLVDIIYIKRCFLEKKKSTRAPEEEADSAQNALHKNYILEDLWCSSFLLLQEVAPYVDSYQLCIHRTLGILLVQTMQLAYVAETWLWDSINH